MNEYLSNNKNNKPKNILILILIIITCIIYSFSVWADEEQLQTSSSQKISEIINSYPDISSFQAKRLLREAEEAVQFGISLEDTKEIIQGSLEKKINIYTVIDLFSLMSQLEEEGLPTNLIINKAKEGLAKGASSNEINLSIKEESKNLQFAKYLVEQSLLEGANIENKGKAIEILASSLPYNHQEDMITDIVKKGILNQKDVKEIAGALTALSNLVNLDMSITSAKVITEDLLREDYSPRDMMTLVNVIAYAQKKGLSVSEINSEIINRIRKGEDALSIEKEVVDYLMDKKVAAKEDEPSSADVTSEEDAVSPTQTTPAPPSVEVTTPEEPSSAEEATTPTQTGGPDAP
jgi:DNA-binding transcriptional MerR regulator